MILFIIKHAFKMFYFKIYVLTTVVTGDDEVFIIVFETCYRPGGGETICPLPMAVQLAADLRPYADGSAVRTRLSCRQPACL